MILEKLDVIGNVVYCYNEQFELVKTLALSEFTDVDFAYLDGSKLFTLNVSQPIKRAIKFTELNGLDSQAAFIEYPYADMTPEEQADFDSFVLQAENL
jgi:hypothetical protein